MRDTNRKLLVVLGLLAAVLVVVMLRNNSDRTPGQIIEARQTVKLLKFAAWDVATCRRYQMAGYEVCRYDPATGYDEDGPYDSIGNRLSRGCDEWIDRATNYCPRCTRAGSCDEPFE